MMRLRDLIRNCFRPDKEIVINRTASIGEDKILLLGITCIEDRCKMWTISASNKQNIVYDRTYPETRRDQILDQIQRDDDTQHISNLLIDGYDINLCGSSSSGIHHNKEEALPVLQHYIEKGLSFEEFKDSNLDELRLYTYDLDDTVDFDSIEYSVNSIIDIRLSDIHTQVLIDMPITLKMDNIDSSKKYSFLDPCTGLSNEFYINKLSLYDIWEETMNKLNTPPHTDLPAEQRESIKSSIEEGLASMCPQGHQLLIIEYECENDLQLRFFTKDYLHTSLSDVSSSSGSFGLIFKPDSDIGSNGYKLRIDTLDSYEKGFNGDIDLVIMSYYKVTKGGLIRM